MPKVHFLRKSALFVNVCFTSRKTCTDCCVKFCFLSSSALLLASVLDVHCSPVFSLTQKKNRQPTRFVSLTGTLLFSGLLCAHCSSSFKLVTLCPSLLVSSMTNVRCYNRHHSVFLLACLNRCSDYSTFPCQNNFYSNVRSNW